MLCLRDVKTPLYTFMSEKHKLKLESDKGRESEAYAGWEKVTFTFCFLVLKKG